MTTQIEYYFQEYFKNHSISNIHLDQQVFYIQNAGNQDQQDPTYQQTTTSRQLQIQQNKEQKDTYQQTIKSKTRTYTSKSTKTQSSKTSSQKSMVYITQPLHLKGWIKAYESNKKKFKEILQDTDFSSQDLRILFSNFVKQYGENKQYIQSQQTSSLKQKNKKHISYNPNDKLIQFIQNFQDSDRDNLSEIWKLASKKRPRSTTDFQQEKSQLINHLKNHPILSTQQTQISQVLLYIFYIFKRFNKHSSIIDSPNSYCKNYKDFQDLYIHHLFKPNHFARFEISVQSIDKPTIIFEAFHKKDHQDHYWATCLPGSTPDQISIISCNYITSDDNLKFDLYNRDFYVTTQNGHYQEFYTDDI